jgi:DNA processing protein
MLARAARNENVQQTFDLLTAALLPGVGPKRVADLAARGALGEVLSRPGDHVDLLPEEARQALRTGAARRAAEEELARARQKQVRIVGRDEPDYPALLRQIYDPPPVLYARGVLAGEEGTRSLGIVGSRAASAQGSMFTRRMARDLASWGATVVSGLARGIDSAAHRGALEAGGRTVAVLGSGVDCIYPSENAALAESLLARGAVVSECPLGTGPQRENFPRRNRIIAGWGVAVVVVEAPERSGALITARVAMEEGRDVLAVPGHPDSALAAGTNALIRDGAGLVRHAEDVATAIGLPAFPSASRTRLDGEADEDPVLGVLAERSPASAEEIQQRCGRPMAEVLSELAALEVMEKVQRLPGGLFIKG